jgi:hypothetical protein
MELVAFVTAEGGKDLIVSFAVCIPDDWERIESLTVIRTPIYEGFLTEAERGATVSFEREKRVGKKALLREVKYAAAERTVTVRTDRKTYKLDIRKVDAKELGDMCRVFRKMNFDSSIKLDGV